MKKTFIFGIMIFFAGYLLYAQPACLKDVTYALVVKNEVSKARKMMEEQCFPGNESSADVWLVRGNVFIQLHQYELDRQAKDSKYVIRWSDAIIIANESFYKAIELKFDVKPSDSRLLDAKDGQVLSADVISVIASKVMDNKDYTEAIRLLNMVIRSYKVDPKTYALYLSYAYLDLANCYKAMGDDANYKKILLDATKLNVAEAEIYINLYDLYKKEKDTVECGEILNKARKVIPDDKAIGIKGSEIDYFAMIGGTVRLKNAAIKMFEQYKDNPEVITIITTHLINNKEYELAQEMIETGLAIDPDNFDLNQLMAYRYNCEALDFIALKDAKLNEKPRKYADAEVAHNKSLEIFEIALGWAEKAYILNSDDRDNNIMLSRIYVRLMQPVPEELQKKVDSYYQKQ